MYNNYMTKTIPITDARNNLPTLVNNASKKFDEYVITVNGTPAAVLLSAAEYESWKETTEILGDKGLLEAIRQGEVDLKHSKYVTLENLKKTVRLHV